MIDIDPEKRNGLLETAALGGDEYINGLTLRPMTAATWSLHQRLKRAAGEEGGEDWSFSIFSFVYLHSQPVEKLRAAYGRPEALLGDVFDFMQTLPAAAAADFKPWMERQMEQFAASITHSASVGAPEADPKA